MWRCNVCDTINENENTDECKHCKKPRYPSLVTGETSQTSGGILTNNQNSPTKKTQGASVLIFSILVLLAICSIPLFLSTVSNSRTTPSPLTTFVSTTPAQLIETKYLPTASPVKPTNTRIPTATPKPPKTSTPRRVPSKTPSPTDADLVMIYGVTFPAWQYCPNSPLSIIQKGDFAFVNPIPPTPNNIREKPEKGGKKIGQIPIGSNHTVKILDGPKCYNQWVWWYVKYKDTYGWTSEGDEYWLIPLLEER